MAFKILSFFGKKSEEDEVINLLNKHLSLVNDADKVLKESFDFAMKGKYKIVEEKNKKIFEIEREADLLKKKMTTMLYEGAFLPAMRSNLYQMIMANDVVCNDIQNAASMLVYLKIFKLPKSIWSILERLQLKSSESIKQLNLVFGALIDYKKNIDSEVGRIRMIESEADALQKELFETMYFGKKGKKDALIIHTVGKFGHNLSVISDSCQSAAEIML